MLNVAGQGLGDVPGKVPLAAPELRGLQLTGQRPDTSRRPPGQPAVGHDQLRRAVQPGQKRLPGWHCAPRDRFDGRYERNALPGVPERGEDYERQHTTRCARAAETELVLVK